MNQKLALRTSWIQSMLISAVACLTVTLAAPTSGFCEDDIGGLSGLCGYAALTTIVGRDVPRWTGAKPGGRGFPVVGESRKFWTYDLSVMPPKNVQVRATCRAVGAGSAIWVADLVWGKTTTQSDVELLLKALETETPSNPGSGIIQNNSQLFGEPPKYAVGDPELTVLLYDIPSYKGYQFDGFFRAEDLQPFNPSCANNPMLYCSNELGMIHVDSVGIGTPYMHGVIAHEFEHLAHFGADPTEEMWLNESLAELAMVYSGYEDPANLKAFAANPSTSLIVTPPVNYGAALLFGAYLHQQVGDDGVMALVTSKLKGVTGIEAVLPSQDQFPEFFARWTAANIMDNPTLKGGKFGYSLVEVPQFATTSIAVGSTDKTVQIPASAGVYMEIQGMTNDGVGVKAIIDEANEGVLGHLVVPSESFAEPVLPQFPVNFYPSSGTPTAYLVLSNPASTAQSATLSVTAADELPEIVEESRGDVGAPDAVETTDWVEEQNQQPRSSDIVRYGDSGSSDLKAEVPGEEGTEATPQLDLVDSDKLSNPDGSDSNSSTKKGKGAQCTISTEGHETGPWPMLLVLVFVVWVRQLLRLKVRRAGS